VVPQVTSPTGDLTTAVVTLRVNANKTQCFNAFETVPLTALINTTTTIKTTRPAVRSAVRLPRGSSATATRYFCGTAAMLKAGFPARVASRKYTALKITGSHSRYTPLSEPALAVAKGCAVLVFCFFPANCIPLISSLMQYCD
jgi:hypothetical protein